MPLIYGEGRKKAFARLQKEIDVLPPDTSLSSDSRGNGDGAGCVKSLDQAQSQIAPAGGYKEPMYRYSEADQDQPLLSVRVLERRVIPAG
jgi:hypothetical protein